MKEFKVLNKYLLNIHKSYANISNEKNNSLVSTQPLYFTFIFI